MALKDDYQDSDPTAVVHVTHHNALASALNGLAHVNDTPDTDKPVSTAQQAAIDAASTADRARGNHTGTQLAATVSDFSTAADARITAQKGVASGLAPLDSGGKIASVYLSAIAITSVFEVASQAAQLALTAQEGDVAARTDVNQTYMRNSGVAGTMADWTLLPTPTDVVTSIAGRTGVVVLVKADVGLGNADNTSDTAKPVSTAQQTALDLKAPLAGPAFTGTVTGITKTMVGLGNADNTTDTAKPVSTAQQTAIDAASAVDRARGNHTGTQLAATVSDFSTAADARITAQKGAASGLAPLDSSSRVAAAYLAFAVLKAGDTMTGLLALAAGAAGVGGLTIGADVYLYRSAAGTLKTDGVLLVGGAFTATGTTIMGSTSGVTSIGNGSANTDASLNLQAGASGNPQINWSRGGTNLWLDYMSGTTTRYLRDLTNAKMHVTYIPGAGAGGGYTTFNCGLSVAGGVVLGFYPLATTLAVVTWITGDAENRFTMQADGKILWGGGAVAGDTRLYRAAAGVLKTDGVFRPGAFTTALRPTASAAGVGGEIYDTTLSKPVWSDGTAWRDAAGTAV